MTNKMLISLDKINVLLTYRDTDLMTVLQSTDDLETIQLVLQYHVNCLKNGTKEKLNFSIARILSLLNTDNINIICDIVTLAVNIQMDKYSMMTELKQSMQAQEDTLLQLNLLNVILLHSDHELLMLLELEVAYLKTLLQKTAECEETVQNYLIVHILTSYVRLCDVKDILQTVWEEVWKRQNFQLICGLSEHLSLDLLSLADYWHLLQDQLGQGNTYKSAMYLFRMSIDTLKTCDSFNSQQNLMAFNTVDKVEFFKSIDTLCVLLDVSREKQLHLIEPSLASLASITNLHGTWLKLIYTILLRHSHSSVVYRAIVMLLKEQIDFQEHYAEVIKEVLRAFNNAECTTLTKQAFKELNIYSSNLDQETYDALLRLSLEITWVPVASWMFYKNVLVDNRTVSVHSLNQIVQNTKRLPHKYIRKGCLDLVYKHLHHLLQHKTKQLRDLENILLEFIMDDNTRFYASKLMNSRNLIVDEVCLNEISEYLTEEHPNLIKIDLIVEIVNRKNVPFTWIRDKIQIPFKKRKYKYSVLDRLTYSFCIRTTELEHYLMNRLEIDEETCKICHVDKIHASLIKRCTEVLTRNESSVCQTLAFEILFYANESRFKQVYECWMSKILQGNNKIDSNLALGFINLLTKVPIEYIRNGILNVSEMIGVYQIFFNTQPDEVAVKIFRNLDLILEYITADHLEFLDFCFLQLSNMRRSEHFEIAARYFIRSIALSHGKIDDRILRHIMQEMFRFTKTSNTIAYYSVLYFKSLKVHEDVFPIFEFVLYGCIHSKDESAEYEVCREVYFNTHAINPCFRNAEIRKWAIENILSDIDEARINEIVTTLIDRYKLSYKKRYFPDSQIHLHKLRIMQTFCFVIPYVTGEAKEKLKGLLVESFCEENHQLSVRQLMQYILIQLLRNDASCLDLISKTIEAAGKMHTSTITGFIPVLYGIDLFRNNIEFSMSLIETMLPWTMGAHFKLRLYSQFVICKICDKYNTNRKFKQKHDTIHKAVQSVLAATTPIDHSITKDIDLIKYVCVERPHADSRRLIYLVSVYIPETTTVNTIEWEYFKIKNSWFKYSKENQLDTDIEISNQEVLSNVQKKLVPWQEFFETPRKLGQLILVASLIDSAANLGGLSRTCEIFGVKQMIVNNSKIVSDKEFQSLSMSSEKLVDIVEVKLADLNGLILKAKADGYTCIGAEQTTKSVSLNSYCFIEKTLILLGNERSGIHPNLIPLLDACVEIPQFGVVRSFNVHVAGAMFMWEYTKQHTVPMCLNVNHA